MKERPKRPPTVAGTADVVSRWVVLLLAALHSGAGALQISGAVLTNTPHMWLIVALGTAGLLSMILATTLYNFIYPLASGENFTAVFGAADETSDRRRLMSIWFGYFFVASQVMLVLIQFVQTKFETIPFTVWTGHYSRVPSLASESLMLAPLMVAVLVPRIPWGHVLFYWITGIALLGIGAFADRSPGSLYVVAHYGLSSALVLWALRQKGRSSVETLTTALANDKQEHERSLEASEHKMRHLIANVAHDLKTPLSSFMAGVDNISHSLDECEETLHAVGSLSGFANDVRQCLATMAVTNQFMLMAVNRVMDYTKASRGVKLVPKYETVDLAEALALPMSCMKDIQERVEMRIDPLPHDLCSHIIADKQWLQENVLCLLSNAVKYSSGGEVAIRVKLQQSTAHVLTPTPSAILSPQGQAGSPTTFAWSSPKATKRKTSVSPSAPPNGNSERTSFSTSVTLVTMLRVEVEDMGIGMTEEAMRELFSPFKQTQRLAGGTGLGLFSLAQRVEALHGKCGVQRRRDGRQGSLFWFSFPYRPDNDARLQLSPGSAAHPKALMSRGKSPSSAPPSAEIRVLSTTMPTHGQDGAPLGLKVLLVDDSPTVLSMTAMMLRKAGYDVTTAENGAVALNIIEKRLAALHLERGLQHVALRDHGEWVEIEPLFDVIVSDLQMPVMDGLEAVKRLREREEQVCEQVAGFTSNTHVPDVGSGSARTRRVTSSADRASTPQLRHVVIGLSANSEEETLQETLSAGFDGFLCKPFALSAFRDLLRELS